MSIRDKKILLMFLGIVLLVLSYFFIYVPQNNLASNIEQENVTLQGRLDELLKMAENKEFYQQEIQDMSGKIEEYCINFPAAVKEEDGILLANRMEKKIDMKISNVGLGEKEMISAISNEEPGQETGTDETLMEQGDADTQGQISEIEGAEGETADAEAGPLDGADTAIADYMYNVTFNPTLYRNQDTLQFVTTYEGLKGAVKYLNTQAGRMTVDNVNASFDSATGNLSGTMVVNLYSMENTGTTYSEPDAGKVKLGTKNIFGTIEIPVKEAENNAKSQ